jgi:hypothetical protein
MAIASMEAVGTFDIEDDKREVVFESPVDRSFFVKALYLES